MKQYIFLLFIFTTIISCSSSKMITDNNLTNAEKKDGYLLLFDGKTMNGWRTYQNKPSDSWTVNNGTLYCKGSATNKSDKRADLITNDQFENFDLSLDWKISPQGNSGIIYMVTEQYPASYLSGPEYQIIDDNNFPEKLENWQKTAANYAMNPAPDAVPNPVGEWNHTRIVVNRGHVEHWLNGKKVVEYELWTDEWKKNKMAGKWKDAPGYGQSKRGHIALQDHGSEAWFKNIRIRQL
jgi:3-keto-disaccharide hydrolase